MFRKIISKWKSEREEPDPLQPVTNREYLVVSYFFLIIFIAMMLYFILFQFVLKDEFVSSRKNTLQDLMAEYVVRGKIYSADGQILAETLTDDYGNETRYYPYGRIFAHAVGYMSNGKLGVENQANFKLLTSHEFILKRIRNDFKNEKNIGDNVRTTLRTDLQQIAYYNMGSFNGAVVALDPSTGAILAMVSKPDFDPSTIEWEWNNIINSDSDILFNRVTQGQYAPGSTFKLFTLLEYYREHPNDYQDYYFNCPGYFTAPDGDTIQCAGHRVHGEQTLMQSFANSCNSSFSNISLQLDANAFRKTCDGLLLNRSVPGKLASSSNVFTLDSSVDIGTVMRTGIGQGETLVSPLYMALITGSICNDGVLMKPYVIASTETAGGVVVQRTHASSYGRILDMDEVSFLREYMKDVVQEGTASMLATDQYEVYGKTGSAQTSESLSVTNAWFIGYAKKGDKEIAVAIVVEDAGAGSTYAAPLAKLLFDQYLLNE